MLSDSIVLNNLSNDKISTLATSQPYICKTPNFLERLGDPWYHLLAQIQHTINIETHLFWSNRGLISLNLPITTGTISSPMGISSDSLPVKINLLGVQTYLADSMQFSLEYGCRLSERGTYYIMPTFRGENQDPTHLSQFFHSEAEIKCNLQSLISLIEQYLLHLCSVIVEKHLSRIERIGKNLNHVKSVIEKKGFDRITFSEAQALLGSTGNYFRYLGGETSCITREGEKMLIKKFGGAVWLTEMEHRSDPLYKSYASDPKYAKCSDLLLGFGEIVGAGERHSQSHEVEKALLEHQVNPSEFNWYIAMKKSHPLQTSGFGLGVERFLMWILGHDDIRDMQILPRINGINLYP